MAIQGRVQDGLAEAERGLVDGADAPQVEQAGLWYALARVQLARGSMAGVLTAAERCIALARAARSPGWTSSGLSVRAMALVRLGRMEPALLDLARAEAELTDCTDPRLLCWSHTGLGWTYLELRLFELAQPHLERAQMLDASPVPLAEAPVIDLVNLVELHLRWAEELERVRTTGGCDDEVDMHRRVGHAYAVRALSKARRADHASLTATCHALELTSRPRDDPRSAVPALRGAFSADRTGGQGGDRGRDQGDDHEWEHGRHQGGRAVVGSALARALWMAGDRVEAVDVAREAVALADEAGDWQVSASTQWLLVELESQTGVPGAAAGRSYAALLTKMLWQQRLSTLQGAQAALRLERLHRDKELAQRAATEDALTGVANRRALDARLETLQAEADDVLGSRVGVGGSLSLLVIDLDDFKDINDTHGHGVGDEVLRAVAAAVRCASRATDLVARLGGDEFVVLARGADEQAGLLLAERVTQAISALRVETGTGPLTLSASVGVATAGTAAHATRLLAAADEAMYAVKGCARRRIGRQRSADGLPADDAMPSVTSTSGSDLAPRTTVVRSTGPVPVPGAG